VSATPPSRTRLVGDRFDLVPGQSAFGCLARLARLNYFGPADWHRAFGLRVLRSDDLPRALAMSESRQRTLAGALGIERPSTWAPDTWRPFCGRAEQMGTSPFRYCVGCIRVGYHPYLHQLPWIERCPWHGIRLRTCCPRCGGSIATSGDTGRKLLTCACGLDLMNEVAAARLNQQPRGAAEYITRYLAWAAGERGTCTLIWPANASPEIQPLASLIRMPAELEHRARSIRNAGSHVRRCHRGIRADQTQPVEDAKRLAGLSGDCPQILHVPCFMVSSINAVAKNLARKLPAGSLTLREQLLFLGGISHPPSGFVAAVRSTSGTIQCLPPMLVGSQRYLNLATVHPVIGDAVVRLGTLYKTRKSELGSEDPSDVDLLLLKIQREILCRGYAEGLRAVISQYVPDLYFSRRDRPHLTAPWVLLRVTASYCSARQGYVRLDRNEGAADALTSATCRRTRPYC